MKHSSNGGIHMSLDKDYLNDYAYEIEKGKEIMAIGEKTNVTTG